MSEQLSLIGDTVVTAEDGTRLGPAQQAVLEQLQQFGRLDDDEAGAILHERRGKHQRDERCEWCARDGRDVLKSLRGHNLAREKRGDGWIDPSSIKRKIPHNPEARARRSDPVTSHRAADSVGDLRESQRAVLSTFLQHGPMHDEQLANLYTGPRQSVSGLRTRRHELAELGLLSATGDLAKTTYGRDTAVWGLTDKGRQQAENDQGGTVDPLEAIGF